MSTDSEVFNVPLSIHWINMIPSKKYLRANHSNFVIKELSKAIMNRSRLRDQFLQNKSAESRMKCNKKLIFVQLYFGKLKANITKILD